MYSTRINQARLKSTESFSVSVTHSWLCGVIVMTHDWESVGVQIWEVLFFGKKSLV